MFSRSLYWASLVVVLASMSAVAQPVHLLDCAEVNLLGPSCEDAVAEEESVALATPPAPEPLFTLQTMRPDTPPLLLKVFNDPSDANIQAFLDWEHRYLSRTFEVEAKLKHHRQQRKR